MIAREGKRGHEQGGTMIRLRALAVLGLLAVAATAFAATSPAGGEGGKQIVIRDDCDPRDTEWNRLGGCALRHGNVTLAEFDEELDSPLAAAVVGHQSWRNDPSYLEIKEGQSVHVVNRGGRPHTFTEVKEFGGGFVPPLNEGLTTAGECAGASVLPPGASTTLSGLAPGNHRMMCCIHPWMRALVKVHDRPGH
jgi:plastocyanin